jgi:hypothetical protein
MPKIGIRMYLEIVYNVKQCTMAISGTDMELMVNPYRLTVFIIDVPRNIGRRIEKHVLLRLCTMTVLRYPLCTQADPIQPAVNNSAIAWPAAPNAFAVVGDLDSAGNMLSIIMM